MIDYSLFNAPVGAKEAASLFEVHPDTLRNWTKTNSVPYEKTPGGHRRYDVREIFKAFDNERPDVDKEIFEELVSLASSKVRDEEQCPWFGDMDSEEQIAIMEFQYWRPLGYCYEWEITRLISPSKLYRDNVKTVREMEGACYQSVLSCNERNYFGVNEHIVELEKQAIARFRSDFRVARLCPGYSHDFALTGLWRLSYEKNLSGVQ